MQQLEPEDEFDIGPNPLLVEWILCLECARIGRIGRLITVTIGDVDYRTGEVRPFLQSVETELDSPSRTSAVSAASVRTAHRVLREHGLTPSLSVDRFSTQNADTLVRSIVKKLLNSNYNNLRL